MEYGGDVIPKLGYIAKDIWSPLAGQPGPTKCDSKTGLPWILRIRSIQYSLYQI